MNPSRGTTHNLGQAWSKASGTASASGNNLCVTPASGKKLRCYYLSYNPNGDVTAGFRFGAAGPLFLLNHLTVSGSVIAKATGDYFYLEGAVDEPLYLNLSSAVSTLWNAFYLEM